MSKLQQKKKEFLGFKDVHAEKEKSVKWSIFTDVPKQTQSVQIRTHRGARYGPQMFLYFSSSPSLQLQHSNTQKKQL